MTDSQTNDQARRFEKACRVGYLVTSGEERDYDLGEAWTTLATSEGFPLVLVAPRRSGISVAVMLGEGQEDGERLLDRALSLMQPICRRYPGARARIHSAPQRCAVASGIPTAAARELAGMLARMNGYGFPVEGSDVQGVAS